MKYVYPAIFTPLTEGEFDGGFAVSVPDLPYTHTFGKDLAEAIEMAEDAIGMWLADHEDKNFEIPKPSTSLHHEAPDFVNLIKIDTTAWRRTNDNRSIRKNLTIPAWLNNMAEDAHVNFSSVLQEALKAHLKIHELKRT